MSHSSPSHRVLIVDDEPLIRWALQQTLTDSGDIVSEAGSAESALQLLKDANAPDVVLLDYFLPDSCDFRLLATVKRLVPRAQVIVMSAHCTPEIVRQAMLCGAHDVVQKPFEMDGVSALVSSAAEARPA
jgi:DNA-binding NtrC family response regulator